MKGPGEQHVWGSRVGLPLAALAGTLFGVLALLAGAPAASGTAVFVGTNLTDDAATHTWDTIQEGINDSAPGDAVFVYNGSYNESVGV